jgi:hypothetical protein
MKRVLLILIASALLCFEPVAWAGETVSDQTQDTTPDPTDLIMFEKADGSDYVYSTLQQAIDVLENAGTDVNADLEEETHATEHAIGGGDALDSVSEGNSNVEVIDTGTGEVNVDVDGEQQVDIADGVTAFINGTKIRVMTTTDGHEICFGGYDVDGTAWVDILCVGNDNDPYMELQSGATFKGLGVTRVPRGWINDSNGRDIAVTEMNGGFLASGSGDFYIPADMCDTATGNWLKVKIDGGAYNVSVGSYDTADLFVLTNGSNTDAGDEIDLNAADGALVYIECAKANEWHVTDEIGTVTDGGAS